MSKGPLRSVCLRWVQTAGRGWKSTDGPNLDQARTRGFSSLAREFFCWSPGTRLPFSSRGLHWAGQGAGQDATSVTGRSKDHNALRTETGKEHLVARSHQGPIENQPLCHEQLHTHSVRFLVSWICSSSIISHVTFPYLVAVACCSQDPVLY